jgi:hypothetical protein
MRFHLVRTPLGDILGVYTRKREALKVGEASGGDFEILGMEIPVNAESISRLLAEQGGYCTKVVTSNHLAK